MTERTTTLKRQTNETTVELTLSLDGGGAGEICTGVAFLDHMLAQVARHGRLDMDLRAVGDLAVDAHHTVEDCGILLGTALAACWGDKAGVRRFGYAYAPLDEALSRAVVDLSGRPSLHYCAALSRPDVGGMDADLFREFFQGLVNNAGMTLHLDVLRGVNAHHQVESMFKAFALALRAAVAHDGGGDGGIPSTKGRL